MDCAGSSRLTPIRFHLSLYRLFYFTCILYNVCMPKGMLQFVLISLCFTFNMHAQNLVPNGDFEQYEKCPTESAQFDQVKQWKSPTQATPDLLSSCAKVTTLVSVPLNFAGNQDPHSGQSYIGLLAFHSDNYYEYISVKLQQPLVKNKKYLLSFFYTLSDYSNRQVGQLGALFHKDAISLSGQPLLEQFSFNDTIVNNIRLWKEYQHVYTASGTEEYLTIGCFTKDVSKTRGDTPPKGYGPFENDFMAYYYIDDVSLTEYNGQPLIQRETASNAAAFQPENICFDSDKSDLLPQYRVKVDRLVAYLKQHPSENISLAGHTDNTGNNAYNMRLSKERVNTIKNYLMQKGIAEKRIIEAGYGSRKPIKTNSTEEGKWQNRRVECKIVLGK